MYIYCSSRNTHIQYHPLTSLSLSYLHQLFSPGAINIFQLHFSSHPPNFIFNLTTLILFVNKAHSRILLYTFFVQSSIFNRQFKEIDRSPRKQTLTNWRKQKLKRQTFPCHFLNTKQYFIHCLETQFSLN